MDRVREIVTGTPCWANHDEFAADRKSFLAAVRQDGRALEDASVELSQDREVVLAAVQQHGYALQYASAELQQDREVVLTAVRQDGRALQQASAGLKQDREVVLAAVQQDGLALWSASPELRQDRELVLAAVRRDGEALGYAADTLLNDDNFVLAALRLNPEAHEEAARILGADKLRKLLASDVPLDQPPTTVSVDHDNAPLLTPTPASAPPAAPTSTAHEPAAEKSTAAGLGQLESPFKREPDTLVKEEKRRREEKQVDEEAGARQRVRVKREAKAQRTREAEDGLQVTESIDLTGEPGLPRHMPAEWASMGEEERQAWIYDWHQAQSHRGQRLCPECFARQAVKYIQKQLRNGRSQFTCNSLTCRSCYAEYCLNCGKTKGGGRGSGYHHECGRQPSWLTALEGVPHLAEDDPRVQQPPPLLRRGSWHR